MADDVTALRALVLYLARAELARQYPPTQELWHLITAAQGEAAKVGPPTGGGPYPPIVAHKLPSRQLYEQRVDLLVRRLSELADEGKGLDAGEVWFQHEMLPVGWTGEREPPG